MTRFCIRCNRIIGEKCILCGAEAVPSSKGRAVTVAAFNCPSCGRHFLRGDGGETGGMCEPCFDAELQKAREWAGKAEAKDAAQRSATGKPLASRRTVRVRSNVTGTPNLANLPTPSGAA